MYTVTPGTHNAPGNTKPQRKHRYTPITIIYNKSVNVNVQCVVMNHRSLILNLYRNIHVVPTFTLHVPIHAQWQTKEMCLFVHLFTSFLCIFDEVESCPVFDWSSRIQILSLHGYGTPCLLTQLVQFNQWRAEGKVGAEGNTMELYLYAHTNSVQSGNNVNCRKIYEVCYSRLYVIVQGLA